LHGGEEERDKGPAELQGGERKGETKPEERGKGAFAEKYNIQRTPN